MNYERGRRTANRCALLASCAAVGMCIIAVFLMRISAFDKPFERESHYSCRAHDQSDNITWAARSHSIIVNRLRGLASCNFPTAIIARALGGARLPDIDSGMALPVVERCWHEVGLERGVHLLEQ